MKKVLSILLCLLMVMMPLTVGATHQCISRDGDIWCDVCGEWMEHECVDEDEDFDMAANL